MTVTGNAPKTFKVGLVIGSQRPVRAGPQISDFILAVIKLRLGAEAASQFSFEIVDVATLGLPLLDEPGIPRRIKDLSGYQHEHTRAWSRRISALDAFVFVTPQYNWGVPAGLKNAIHYLYNEWSGKPAMIVSYGGHGGEKAYAALKTILGGGLDMKVPETAVNLSFSGLEGMIKAATGSDLGLDATEDDAPWSDKKELIGEAWDEVVAMLKA